MKLNNLFDVKKKKKKRLGRGNSSGTGKTCGKGHKGQKARSGKKIRSSFEGGQTPLFRTLPKFGFKSFNKNNIAIKLSLLNRFNNCIIDLNFLKTHSLIQNYIKNVKIVFSNNFFSKITLIGLICTKNAKKKILELNGNIIY